MRLDALTELPAVADRLLHQEAIGLDVETTFPRQRLCTVQIASPSDLGIIDALAVDLLPLAPVFSGRSPIKIIHNASFERRVLGEHGLELAGVFDTLKASRTKRGRRAKGGHRLDAVCRRELGINIDKEEQRSDWSRRPLSARQLRYAAVMLELFEQLRTRNGLL